jgi:hypothetical protein
MVILTALVVDVGVIAVDLQLLPASSILWRPLGVTAGGFLAPSGPTCPSLFIRKG